jgi:hypothetical protein
VGTVIGGGGYDFYTFNEGPITDAQITGCGITSMTIAWTGDPVSALGAALQLATSNGVGAGIGPNPGGGTTSPQTYTNIFYWLSNRPYNGVDIESTNNWNLGVLTVTLA